jgi:cyclophilin family peptidyl-prolyl cis-trans isomerase
MQDLKTKLVVAAAIILTAGTVLYMNQEPKIVEDNFESTSMSTEVVATTTKEMSTTTIKNNNMTENNTQKEEIKSAKISTSMGTIEIEFTPKTAPNTVANFVKLAGEKFYDNVKFHRVIKGFMIQTGDPLSKDASKQAYWGTGGPGYKFADELSGRETYKQGTVAMANSGPNTNGSQFFIVTAMDSGLPASYTVFGKVIKGMDIALKIENVNTDQSDRPFENVTINSITLVK